MRARAGEEAKFQLIVRTSQDEMVDLPDLADVFSELSYFDGSKEVAVSATRSEMGKYVLKYTPLQAGRGSINVEVMAGITIDTDFALTEDRYRCPAQSSPKSAPPPPHAPRPRPLSVYFVACPPAISLKRSLSGREASPQGLSHHSSGHEPRFRPHVPRHRSRKSVKRR